MKKTLQRQGVLLALALLVLVCAMACGPRGSSAKKRDQRPATGKAGQTAKPGGIAKPGEAPKPGDVDTVDLGSGVRIELVWVPAGSFQMGSNEYDSEKPVHTVELDGLWMGKYEVTQEQYEAVMGRNPSYFKGAKNPVHVVSWNDATDFCRKASEKTGKGSRLPTEAEWEYACRAGSTTRFCSGDWDGGLGDYAWYGYNSANRPHPVGEKKPNDWGLYDMHGNVWEWCGDWYGERYYDESDRKNPQGPSTGECPVMRGGSWCNSSFLCRSAYRFRIYPATAYLDFGFRVVCSGSSSAEKVDQQPAATEADPAAKPEGTAKPSDAPKPGDLDTVDLGGGVKMELVWVPAGSFQMGSDEFDAEKPVHTAELDGFWMGRTEVTQEQYETVIGKNPSNFKGVKNPVEMVSWNDATEFCRKATAKVAQASSPAFAGRTFRLPTEAEWEYACRAGSSTRFCSGDWDGGLGDYAWYGYNSANRPHPVGEKKPNDWGLYDMHGNVWEWCGDWYADKYTAGTAKSPQGPSSGQERVLRGGSWTCDPPLAVPPAVSGTLSGTRSSTTSGSGLFAAAFLLASLICVGH